MKLYHNLYIKSRYIFNYYAFQQIITRLVNKPFLNLYLFIANLSAELNKPGIKIDNKSLDLSSQIAQPPKILYN